MNNITMNSATVSIVRSVDIDSVEKGLPFIISDMIGLHKVTCYKDRPFIIFYITKYVR